MDGRLIFWNSKGDKLKECDDKEAEADYNAGVITSMIMLENKNLATGRGNGRI